MPAGWSMQPPTDERPGRVGLSPRAAGGMDSGPATWLHIYILDYLRKKKMVRSAETFCAEAGLDMSNTATQVPGLWEWWLQMWEARVASRAQPAGDMVLRAQQPELSSLGGELGREAPTRVMTEQQIQQLLFLKRKQAQAQAQAQQAAQAQAQAQVQAQVQAQAHAQVHAQTQVHQAQLQARQAQIQAHAQDQDCAAGLLGQQHQQQDMGVSPWGQQAHYLLQQDQRQELLAGMQGAPGIVVGKQGWWMSIIHGRTCSGCQRAGLSSGQGCYCFVPAYISSTYSCFAEPCGTSCKQQAVATKCFVDSVCFCMSL
ncbi:unnamed protein product [Ostreobium quekettii]|uniref:LisH domain-containing protein n=1 Tax=Ostreobium quekettii TaxID=121088 RepID=A0A8S1JD96_9CHLO|nr:unnamed protein product [Ostreobium quekettii]